MASADTKNNAHARYKTTKAYGKAVIIIFKREKTKTYGKAVIIYLKEKKQKHMTRQ